MKIVIIGAGNIGTHLAIALTKAGLKPVQIISRNENNAVKLGFATDSKVATDISDAEEADIYFITVNDDAITQVAAHPKLKNKFLVHTAGSVDIDVLSRFTNSYGVFYPLQTIKKTAEIDFDQIPLCLEASDNQKLTILENIAKHLSDNVYFVNSSERLHLHIAAVFVNNFANHLFTIANSIIEKENIDSEILKPLINKTLENAINQNPASIQTGPAIRNDQNTIAKHLKVLQKFNPTFADVYKYLTKSIQDFHKN